MAYSIGAVSRAAAGEVGYRERGTNDTKFNRWLGRIDGYGAGGYGYPWCASFLGWAADRAGGVANKDYPRTAGCATAVAWFKKRGRWSSTPHVGDWVFYGPSGSTHVELVVKVTVSRITTIGGNTSGSLDGRYFNGDGVYRKEVPRNSSRIYGYGRPFYEEEDVPLTKEDVEKVADATVKALLTARYNRSGYTVGVSLEKAHNGIVALLAQQSADVDEAEVARLVLAGLTPEKIAAAIPQDIGEQVAEELAARLAAREE
ncbi:CHAP domain-containing protein [Actinomadura soli]|nr:CHAP domain-containing protein [Actinomadura soli]